MRNKAKGYLYDCSIEYLFYRMRPKSLSMPYSFGHFFDGSPIAAKLERKIRPHKRECFGNTIYQSTDKKPCGGDFSLHPQGLTLRAIKATAIPLPDRLRLQGLCISMAYEE
ncbi:hypothetical protein [Bacteroides heparinolyticus]|uniref:hypothetical protein n=1 Tax=Prevotella heparinolytica TaxID=28113 RepID=UPI0035A03500